MIEFNFGISHPFDVDFKSIWCKSQGTPFKNKFAELEIHNTTTLVGFGFRWSIAQDHAGVHIQISLLGYCLSFNFYDNRHWDQETNCWKT